MRAGSGHTAFLKTMNRWPDVTAADLFQRAGEKTPAFVRFSTVAGNKGSADLARDVRGFAVKLYTKQGNWDIVGNNIPVFFIQDAIKFPDLIHAAKAGARSRFPASADGSRQLLGLHFADARKHPHGRCGSCPIGRSLVHSALWKASASTRSGSSTPTANRRL